MSLIPKDAKGSEKIVYILGYGIPVILYFFMQLSAFGVVHNFYSVACKEAGLWWKFLGIGLTAYAVLNLIWLAKDDKETSKGSNVLLAVCAALSLCAYCGFQINL